MNALTIKRIHNTDPLFQQVWNLREEVLRLPLGLSLKGEDLSEELNEDIIVALHDQQVIGCVHLRKLSEDRFKLRQMAIEPRFQGTGTGKILIQQAEILAREKGITHIELHARLEAVPFYLKCGYQVSGNVFMEVGIPHLLMEKQTG